MKTRLLTTALILSVSYGSFAGATEVRVGLRVSGVFPYGFMAEGWDLVPESGLALGAGPGGGGWFSISPWRFGYIELNGDYQKLYGKQKEAKGTLIPFRGGFNLRTGIGPLTVSGGGGVGYYVLKATVHGWVPISSNEEQPEYDWIPAWGKVALSGPGLYFGSCASFEFGRWSLDFTPRWNYIFNEGSYNGKAVGDYEGARFYFDLANNCTYAEAALGVSYRVF